MAAERVIDTDALLAPIPGDNPAGDDIRYTLHASIREARRADDGLPQGQWQHEEKVADWGAVIALSSEALSAKSKDLQVGSWLIEGLLNKHGWLGLRDGFRMLRELIERYWSSVYPFADGDLDGRIKVFEAMNQTLPFSIRRLPVTSPPESYSWFSFDESRTTDNIGRKDPAQKAERLNQGKLSGEQFDKVVVGLGRPFYDALAGDVGQVWDEFLLLERAVDEKFGRETPSLLDIKQALKDCRALIEDDIIETHWKSEPNAVPGLAADGQDLGPAPAAASGPLTLEPRDRPDALRRLAAVATFFRRTEPHSPVGYLVQRAIKWGEISLDEWLKDVIPNNDVLGRLRDTLGIKDDKKD